MDYAYFNMAVYSTIDQYPKTLDEVCELFCEMNGAIEIGRGLYGRVFEMPYSDHVVKIGEVSLNISYLAYVEWALTEGDGNPFVPKFENFQIINEKWFFVTMPKFKACSGNDWSELGYFLQTSKESTDNEIVKYRDVDTAVKSIGTRLGVFKTENAFSNFKQVIDALPPLITHFSEFTKFMFIDLHSKNVMLDDCGNLVITDPLA